MRSTGPDAAVGRCSADPRLLITPQNRAEMAERAKAAPQVWTKIIADAKGESDTALIACATLTAACANSPPISKVAPPRLLLPVEAIRPCALATLPADDEVLTNLHELGCKQQFEAWVRERVTKR